MSSTIETVDIDDVYPLEDAYGNSLARRDYGQKVNKDYVRRLADSFDKETRLPDEMPVLVRDGGIYRIKSGNSRIEAMRLLKVKKFPAVVEDESTARAVLETVWRTDTKKTYEAEEKAEVFRQLALMGTDEYVSGVTGVPVERVRRIRKGAERQGETAAQMTLEWMEAVGEFEDDPAAQEQLLAASPTSWKWTADALRSRKEREAWRAEMEAALAEAGIAVVEDTSGLRYVATVHGADELAEAAGDASAAEFNGAGTCVWLYAPAKAEQIVLADEAAAKLRDEGTALWRNMTDSTGLWLAEHLAEADPAALIGALPGGTEIAVYDSDVLEFLDDHEDAELPIGPAAAIAAYMAMTPCPWVGWTTEPRFGCLRGGIALMDAMERMGWEPSEGDRRLREVCAAELEGKEEADE